MKPVHMFVRPDRGETAFHCPKHNSKAELSHICPYKPPVGHPAVRPIRTHISLDLSILYLTEHSSNLILRYLYRIASSQIMNAWTKPFAVCSSVRQGPCTPGTA